MKKEYVNPSVSVVEINNAGMLCSSDEINNMDFEDGKNEQNVHTESWSGEAL